MPRKQTLCAGGCGRSLHAGRGSLPAGQRTCHSCRAAGRAPASRRRLAAMRPCAVCWTPFLPNDHRDRKQLTCSRKCGAARRGLPGHPSPGPHPCKDCGTPTTRHSQWCGPCADGRRLVRWQRKNLRRRAQGEPMSIAELGARDGWRCHLCRRRVDPGRKWPDPQSASRDHLIPVVDGGTNDPANLALAHLRCNVVRGEGGTVQLLLVG